MNRFIVAFTALFLSIGCAGVSAKVYDSYDVCLSELALQGGGYSTRLNSTTFDRDLDPVAVRHQGNSGGGSATVTVDLTGLACERAYDRRLNPVLPGAEK